MIRKILTIVSRCFPLLIAAFSANAETAVERHGQLKTVGSNIVNKDNEIVQLRGMSFYWSQWEGPQFYTADVLNQLVDSWKCTVVRVAYANGNTGWSSCTTVIDAAIKKGIYVIIDWHSYNAHEQESAALTFFKEQATKYKDIPNVIFEPYNEPKWAGGAEADVGDLANAKKTWIAIKPYLKNVTKAIRATGAQNLVILGTPYYSQFVNVAASDQVVDDGNKPFTNVAYTFHFYAASHGTNSYYMKKDNATSMVPGYLNGGLGKIPIFVTEWGTTHSDGGKSLNPYVDEENTAWWFTNYIDKNHISHCNWAVNNSGDASSAFAGGGGPSNPSASGKVAKKYITVSTVDHWKLLSDNGTEGDAHDSVFAMPGTHPGIGYNRYWGASFTGDDGVPFLLRDDKTNVRTSANTAVIVMGSIGSDEWVAYNIKSSKASTHILFRYLAVKGTGTINILLDGNRIGTVSFTATPADSTWGFKVVPAAVSSGDHKLKFEFANATGEGYYFSWFELSDNPNIPTLVIPHAERRNPAIFIAISRSKDRIILALPEVHPYKSYTLFGIDGRAISSSLLSKERRTININELSPGTYFIKFIGETHSFTRKIVLNSK
jgi:aryl-phospho-beta-D-glucosidase BglC (GH1 family)